MLMICGEAIGRSLVLVNPMLCDPKFTPLLRQFSWTSLSQHGGTIFGLWSDWRLAYANPGWLQFAAENGAPDLPLRWPIGRNVLEGFEEPLRSFYEECYEHCLKSGEPWQHVYECSTPGLIQLCHMTAYPLGQAEGLLIVNSSRLTLPAGDELGSRADIERRFRDGHGTVLQCCHCRRVRENQTDGRWNWVEPWGSRSPAATTHGLCEVCLDFFYPELHDEEES